MNASRLILKPNFRFFILSKIFDNIGFWDDILFSSFGRGKTDSYFGFSNEFIKLFIFDIFCYNILRVYNDLIKIDYTGKGLKIALFGFIPNRFIVLHSLNNLFVHNWNQFKKFGAILVLRISIFYQRDKIFYFYLNRDMVNIFNHCRNLVIGFRFLA